MRLLVGFWVEVCFLIIGRRRQQDGESTGRTAFPPAHPANVNDIPHRLMRSPSNADRSHMQNVSGVGLDCIQQYRENSSNHPLFLLPARKECCVQGHEGEVGEFSEVPRHDAGLQIICAVRGGF